MKNNQHLIDEETVASIKALDEDGEGLFAGLIGMFKTDTPPRLEALRLALDSSDSASIAGIAHSLKSGSLSIGAGYFASLCASIEQQARRGDLTSSRSLDSLLASVFTDTCRALEQRME
ncbi:Hpt domain-containing protein [Paenibacillus agri]|uniref:Hpt domain-containing protein n=1 Tax=Paenibacillus agri TaxID=2744309 RepID=A0A850EKL2_9BACL|nr:Hpt domain-containing protein [Paenibacillus agri]NUU60269.1 Hpt domain-containing protein [Paenibacillus agri]